MIQFNDQASALRWIKGRYKRMLFINMQVCSACAKYKDEELYPWAETKTDWDFAEIHHNDWQLFADQWPELVKAHIVPLGAPMPLDYLDRLLEE